MQWIFDENGRRYLDLFAGIVTVSIGHCHPYVDTCILNCVITCVFITWHLINLAHLQYILMVFLNSSPH